jgi:hypothetical protein
MTQSKIMNSTYQISTHKSSLDDDTHTERIRKPRYIVYQTKPSYHEGRTLYVRLLVWTIKLLYPSKDGPVQW